MNLKEDVIIKINARILNVRILVLIVQTIRFAPAVSMAISFIILLMVPSNVSNVQIFILKPMLLMIIFVEIVWKCLKSGKKIGYVVIDMNF